MKSTRYRKVEPATLNRRSVPRYQVEISRASFSRTNNISHEACLEDISIYGCRIAVDAVLQNGEVLIIAFDGSDPVEARVIWQKANKVGCRFVTNFPTAKLACILRAH